MLHKISEIRLTQNFKRMKTYSLAGNGITRLAFSDEDWQARDFIIDQMISSGLKVCTDKFGNVVGRREGINSQAPSIMCGSHIDSVPNGGNFDGVLGVLSALEVINIMNDTGFNNYYPIDICVFMCEESSRFGVATLGSKAMCGQLSLDDMHKLKDKSGKSLYEILIQRGLKPDKLQTNTALTSGKVKACVEMHIEQGRVLEKLQKPIGIVTGIAAPTRLKLSLNGKADHSGATPMNMRNDALCAAAEIILAIEKLTYNASNENKEIVGTVGIINASPNVMNVIPGNVELGIDIRSIHSEIKNDTVKLIKDAIKCIADKRNITYSLTTLSDEQPVMLSNSMIYTIENICQQNNISYHKMPSGAGHDTMHLAKFAPSGMIFIPCRDGISHNPDEWASMQDILQGTELLYKLLCNLATEA